MKPRFNQFKYSLHQEGVLFLVIVVFDSTGSMVLFFKEINVVRAIGDVFPILVAAIQLGRPGLITPLAGPAEIDKPIAAVIVLEVVVYLRWAPVVDANLPFVEFHSLTPTSLGFCTIL